MKNIMKLAVLLILSFDITMATNPPRGMADVAGRNVSSMDNYPSWFSVGHVAIYNSGNGRVLEVSAIYPAIHENSVSKMTNVGHYWGARYGVGSTSQHYQVLSSGYTQLKYRPQYRYTPNYTEGGWGYSWKWSWSKLRWYKSWHTKRARFRCDSFVVYCYKKATGRQLTSTWSTLPSRVMNALPYKR